MYVIVNEFNNMPDQEAESLLASSRNGKVLVIPEAFSANENEEWNSWLKYLKNHPQRLERRAEAKFLGSSSPRSCATDGKFRRISWSFWPLTDSHQQNGWNCIKPSSTRRSEVQTKTRVELAANVRSCRHVRVVRLPETVKLDLPAQWQLPWRPWWAWYRA